MSRHSVTLGYMSKHIATITRCHRGRPYKGRQPKGRVCESEDCNVLLSVYNDDTICAKCYEAIPVDDRTILVGKYL